MPKNSPKNKRVIYFDIIGGASGDMLLASLLDLGIPLKWLNSLLCSVHNSFKISVAKKSFGHYSYKKIIYKKNNYHFNSNQIEQLLKKSSLPKNIILGARDCFQRIFAVERKIHGVKKGIINLHHLGKPDALIEIIGFFACIYYLQVQDYFVSELPLALPAPATASLLKGKKCLTEKFSYESITPTAAVLLSTAKQANVSAYLEKISYAWGDYGESDYLITSLFSTDSSKDNDNETESLVEIEVTIDDMNPQGFDLVFKRLFSLGAYDVYITPIITKKNRPAWILTAIVPYWLLAKASGEIFKHTTTFGLRYWPINRNKLKDRFVFLDSPWGKIKSRQAENKHFKKTTLEYKDCLQAINKYGISLNQIYDYFLNR